MSKLCIIPARGGSKRIPRKNIKEFLGKPIIAYSIEAALNSGLFDEVMVSTDNKEIAKVGRNYGASIPFMRSNTNADDYASTFDVIKEVLDFYNEQGRVFDAVCCIYPTAPFVTSDLLTAADNKYDDAKFDSVFPVIPFSYPIQRALVKKKELIQMLDENYLDSRSQDLETTYHDAGQFYWFNPLVILEKGKIWTGNSTCIVIDELEAQDIDTETDWKLAELKFQLIQDEQE